MVFSPDGQHLAMIGWDGTLKAWETTSGREVLSFQDPKNVILSLCFSPDNRRLATSGTDKKVNVWDVTTGQQVFSFQGPKLVVGTMSYSPNGGFLACASDGTVRVWDLATGRETLQVKGGLGGYSPDGTQLLTSHEGRTCVLRDLATGQEAVRFEGLIGLLGGDDLRGPDGKPRRNPHFSPDGKRFVLIGETPVNPDAPYGERATQVRVWDAQTGRKTYTFHGRASVLLDPDDKQLATVATDGIIRVWDLATGQEVRSLKVGPTQYGFTMSFSPDGKRLACCTSQSLAVHPSPPNPEAKVRVWDVTTGREILSAQGMSGYGMEMVFSSDSSRLVISANYMTTWAWDLTTGQEILHVNENLVAHLRDAQRLVTSSPQGVVRLWDLATGQETLSFKIPAGHRPDVSPHGKRLLCSAEDGSLGVWDLTTGREILSVKSDVSGIGLRTFSPDGSRLAARWTNTVKVWDLTMGRDASP
jgi:WD40 repeat protein